MNRFSTGLVCAAALLVGIMLGTQANGGAWSRPRRPTLRKVSASDRGYHELQTNRSPLAESSELLAKIVRLTTNSVVHIQSERGRRAGG